MINNKYKGDDSTSKDSVNTTSTDQKQINSREDSRSISFAIEGIRRSGFHEHNLLIYSDLPSFRQIYSQCTKQALENNEIVFLATTYDSFDRIEHTLKSKGISVDNEKKDGNLIIVDAVGTYQVDTYGALKLGRSLAMRATREGKAGVFNMSDLGSFFLSESIDTLIEYEQSLPKKWISSLMPYVPIIKATLTHLAMSSRERCSTVTIVLSELRIEADGSK